jgi:hypothetical protein
MWNIGTCEKPVGIVIKVCFYRKISFLGHENLRHRKHTQPPLQRQAVNAVKIMRNPYTLWAQEFLNVNLCDKHIYRCA